MAKRPDDIAYLTPREFEFLYDILAFVPVHHPTYQILALLFDRVATEFYPELELNLVIENDDRKGGE